VLFIQSWFEDILWSAEDNKLLNLDLSNKLLSTEELVSLTYNPDMFILPMNIVGAIDEGLPNKIFEYQALGSQ
jgi:hypothetical protein